MWHSRFCDENLNLGLDAIFGLKNVQTQDPFEVIKSKFLPYSEGGVILYIF